LAISLVYTNTLVYEAVMLGLYGRHYFSRYRAIADLIPANSSVLDVCCGPAILYERYLQKKQVRYKGIDISGPFIERLKKRGGDGLVMNVRATDARLPHADYVIMHASLCHFLPDAIPIVDRMLHAARRQVIIAEPIRNLTNSTIAFLPAIARQLTDPGDGNSAHRFTEQTLDEFFRPYASRVAATAYIPGKREKIFVLDAMDSTVGPKNVDSPTQLADDKTSTSRGQAADAHR
jgi:SAM-dependent methyltransferase